MTDLGRLLVVLGVVLVAVGALLWLGGGRLSFLGRLPGDIHIQRGNWSFHFPVATSLLLSLVLTLILALLSRR